MHSESMVLRDTSSGSQESRQQTCVRACVCALRAQGERIGAFAGVFFVPAGFFFVPRWHSRGCWRGHGTNPNPTRTFFPRSWSTILLTHVSDVRQRLAMSPSLPRHLSRLALTKLSPSSASDRSTSRRGSNATMAPNRLQCVSCVGWPSSQL